MIEIVVDEKTHSIKIHGRDHHETLWYAITKDNLIELRNSLHNELIYIERYLRDKYGFKED